MNFRDVEMMQNAMNTAGSDALKRSQMARQQQLEMERLAMEREMQNARLGAARAHYGAMEAKADEGLQKQDAALKEKQRENTQRIVHDTANNFAGWVKDGIMPPEAATQGLKKMVGQVVQANPDFQADALAQTILDDGFALQKPDGKDIQPKEIKIGGKSVIYNPNSGSFTIPKDEKEPMQEVEATFPKVEGVAGDPGKPASGHLFWKEPAVAPTPAVAGRPEIKVRTHIPATANPVDFVNSLQGGQSAMAAPSPAPSLGVTTTNADGISTGRVPGATNTPAAVQPAPAKRGRMPWEPAPKIGFDPTNTPPELAALLQSANDALAKGADYDAVTNRLSTKYGINLK